MKWIATILCVSLIVVGLALMADARGPCAGGACAMPNACQPATVTPPVCGAVVEVPATVAVTTRHREVTRVHNVTRVDTEAYRPARVGPAKLVRTVVGHQRRVERRSERHGE